MATISEVKSAITTNLTRVSVPKTGGTYSGSLMTTGDDNYTKAPQMYVHGVNVETIPYPVKSVTVNKLYDIVDLGYLPEGGLSTNEQLYSRFSVNIVDIYGDGSSFGNFEMNAPTSSTFIILEGNDILVNDANAGVVDARAIISADQGSGYYVASLMCPYTTDTTKSTFFKCVNETSGKVLYGMAGYFSKLLVGTTQMIYFAFDSLEKAKSIDEKLKREGSLTQEDAFATSHFINPSDVGKTLTFSLYLVE